MRRFHLIIMPLRNKALNFENRAFASGYGQYDDIHLFMVINEMYTFQFTHFQLNLHIYNFLLCNTKNDNTEYRNHLLHQMAYDYRWMVTNSIINELSWLIGN